MAKPHLLHHNHDNAIVCGVMSIGSLFAGLGGIEKGLEDSGLGETVWQVEIDPYCRAVLAKHWPNAERFEDVRSVGRATLASVDLICGGFPCTDVSSLGKRAGITGAASGLWFEYLRVVSELQPSWVVVENVTRGANRWVDHVVGGLAELGYTSLPVPIAAADVGAPHHRARVFIVAAHADAQLVRREQGRCSRANRTREAKSANDCKTPWGKVEPSMVGVGDGIRGRLDRPTKRISALGNAVVPSCAEVVGYVIQDLMQ